MNWNFSIFYNVRIVSNVGIIMQNLMEINLKIDELTSL